MVPIGYHLSRSASDFSHTWILIKNCIMSTYHDDDELSNCNSTSTGSQKCKTNSISKRTHPPASGVSSQPRIDSVSTKMDSGSANGINSGTNRKEQMEQLGVGPMITDVLEMSSLEKIGEVAPQEEEERDEDDDDEDEDEENDDEKAEEEIGAREVEKNEENSANVNEEYKEDGILHLEDISTAENSPKSNNFDHIIRTTSYENALETDKIDTTGENTITIKNVPDGNVDLSRKLNRVNKSKATITLSSSQHTLTILRRTTTTAALTTTTTTTSMPTASNSSSSGALITDKMESKLKNSGEEPVNRKNSEVDKVSTTSTTNPGDISTVVDGVAGISIGASCFPVDDITMNSSINSNGDNESPDPLPKKLQQTVNTRLKNDLVVSCFLAIVVFSLHCSTVFTVLQPDLNIVLYGFTGSLGFLLHYIIPQLRKHMPWLCFAKPILRQHEYGRFEVSHAPKVMWFEKFYIYMSLLERNVLFPLLVISALTADSVTIANKYGNGWGALIITVCGLKCK